MEGGGEEINLGTDTRRCVVACKSFQRSIQEDQTAQPHYLPLSAINGSIAFTLAILLLGTNVCYYLV